MNKWFYLMVDDDLEGPPFLSSKLSKVIYFCHAIFDNLTQIAFNANTSIPRFIAYVQIISSTTRLPILEWCQ